MAQAPLNRLISVTGTSTITMLEDTRYAYSSKTAFYPTVGGWTAWQLDAQDFADRRFDSDGQTFADIPTSGHLAGVLSGNAGILIDDQYFLAGDTVNQVVLPFPATLADEVPFTLRIHGPNDANYLEATVVHASLVTFRAEITRVILGYGFNLWIEDPVTQVGVMFDVGDLLTLSIVGRASPQPVSEATKRVWARLSERGADVGLVVGDLGAGEGSQERIEARIRYDRDLAIAKEFTDDLGRRWFATSSRTVDDRRYLAFEGVRVVTGIDLPEFGVGA